MRKLPLISLFAATLLPLASRADSAAAAPVAAPAPAPASAQAPAPAGNAAPAADTSGSSDADASRYETTLLDVARDTEKLFSDMEQGRLDQQDFERRVVTMSARYDELMTRDPHNVNTLILYGKFLRRVGQNDVANNLFLHADHLSPDLAVVKQQLGNYMAEQGNYAGALAMYLRAVDLEPKEAVYHFGLGELLATFRDKFVADGAYTNASIDAEILSAFQRAASLDAKNKDFAFRHAEAYYDLSTPRWEEALALWATVGNRTDLNRYEKDAVRLHMARIDCELGRNAEALALVKDDVVPILQATRARLMRRINSSHSAAADKANAEAVLPDAQKPSAAQSAPSATPDLPKPASSSTTPADSTGK